MNFRARHTAAATLFIRAQAEQKANVYAPCLFRNAEIASTAKNSCAHYAESGYGERAKFKECFLEVLPSSLKVNAKKRASLFLRSRRQKGLNSLSLQNIYGVVRSNGAQSQPRQQRDAVAACLPACFLALIKLKVVHSLD